MKKKNKRGRRRRRRRKKNVPGYEETNNFDISIKQGKIVKLLRNMDLFVEGNMEHFLKKEQSYLKQAIKYGYTPGSPHIIIHDSTIQYSKCNIYLFDNEPKYNNAVKRNLQKQGQLILSFKESHNERKIMEIIEREYLKNIIIKID